jgi:hypothetical protein
VAHEATNRRYNRQRMRSVAVLLMFCAGALAERPRAVELVLRDGAASVDGRLRGRRLRQYTVAASGQAITFEFTAEPMRSAGLEVYDPDGRRVLLQKEAAGRWTAPVSKPGNYTVMVVRPTPSASTSYYRLRVTLR